ncbi:hypothetical protein [Streptomyces sp. NPDC048445]|uniref:hypothetical protein n=1 Tax=Streptomyces sp. NPDC048445 TaxID=3365553 RepID=UPI00371F0F11
MVRIVRTVTRRSGGRTVPGPRDGSAGPGDQGGTGERADPGRAPAEPFNRRIEVLIAVVDSPDETSLAAQLLEGRGWSVRPWHPHAHSTDASDLGVGRVGLLAEVRLHGARFGAVQAAVSEIENLARRHQAGMWVLDAVLIEHDLAHDYRSVFHAHRRLPETSAPSGSRSPRAWIAGLRTSLGLISTVRILKQTPRPSVESLEQRLEGGALTGRPYDPQSLQLRSPMGMEGRDLSEPPPVRVSAWRLAGPVLAGLVLAVACGIAAAATNGLSMLVPLLMACALVWPVGHELTNRREEQPRAVTLAWGTAAVMPMTVAGVLLTLTMPGPPTQVARVTAYAVLGVVLCGLILYGLGYALVHSWFSRNANWAVPALVPALALSLPWFGGLLHTMYLKAGFGIPSDAVQVSVYWTYAASLKPVGIALGLAVVILALAGWARHYHARVHARGMVRIGVPLMSVFVIGISLTTGLVGAEGAANRARAAAASGETPAAYYGAQGQLVCVKPVSKEIPVFNGPLATARPLLTFGTSGDRVWLWDARRDESLSVRLEDVVVTEAGGSACR